MRRSCCFRSGGWSSAVVAGAGLVAALTVGSFGCAAGTSTVAASAYRKAAVYGTSKAYVQMVPEDAFDPGVAILSQLEDAEITALDEDFARCTATFGDRVLTFRVFESGDGRSRLSLLVGGGADADANQELADQLMKKICEHLEAACE